MKPNLFIQFSLFIFCLFILSCNNEETTNIDPETGNEQLASFIGAQHNYLLNDFYQKRGEIQRVRASDTKDGDSLEEELSFYIFEYSLPGYIETNVITTEEAELITPYIEEQLNFLFEIISENTSDNFFKLSLDNALQLGAISNKTYEFLLSNLNGDNDVQTSNQRLEEYIQSNELSLTEQNTLNVFKEVLNYSAEYWSADNTPSTRLKGSSWAILADAAGAALGTLGGPGGSIILGAAWSIVVNERHG